MKKLNLIDLKTLIATLDLSSVVFTYKKAKFDANSPMTMPIEKVMDFYRGFLFLNAIHPDERVVPSKEIDVFWHSHILDTEKYAKDCKIIFGYFFHHYPFFGLRSTNDANIYGLAIERSKKLFIQLTGRDPFSIEQAAAMCGGGGGGGDGDGHRISHKYAYEARPSLLRTL